MDHHRASHVHASADSAFRWTVVVMRTRRSNSLRLALLGQVALEFLREKHRVTVTNVLLDRGNTVLLHELFELVLAQQGLVRIEGFLEMSIDNAGRGIDPNRSTLVRTTVLACAGQQTTAFLAMEMINKHTLAGQQFITLGCHFSAWIRMYEFAGLVTLSLLAEDTGRTFAIGLSCRTKLLSCSCVRGDFPAKNGANCVHMNVAEATMIFQQNLLSQIQVVVLLVELVQIVERRRIRNVHNREIARINHADEQVCARIDRN